MLFVVSVLAMIASAAGSAGSLPALGGCAGSLLVRPASISFCGDGNAFVTGLRWSRWGRHDAVASGLWHQNTCKPFCAGAPFRTYRVMARLFRPERCDNGTFEFTRIRWRFLAKKPERLSRSSTISAPLTAPYLREYTKCP